MIYVTAGQGWMILYPTNGEIGLHPVEPGYLRYMIKYRMNTWIK